MNRQVTYNVECVTTPHVYFKHVNCFYILFLLSKKYLTTYLHQNVCSDIKCCFFKIIGTIILFLLMFVFPFDWISFACMDIIANIKVDLYFLESVLAENYKISRIFLKKVRQIKTRKSLCSAIR